MSTRGWWVLVVGLLVVIVVLAWILFAAPARVEAPAVATSTLPVATTPAPAEEPLHARVVITSPKTGATLPKQFSVSGTAPGGWFFEATFPIQVRDPNGNVIGRIGANAQGEWMTEKSVAFTATMNIDAAYSGPATLILMRDNPSGLPENDDSLEVPIVIQ